VKLIRLFLGSLLIMAIINGTSVTKESKVDGTRNQNENKSKNTSNNKMASKNDNRALEDDDFEEDETLGERLIGLTEMFPEPVRKGFVGLGCITSYVSKNSWWLLTNGLWVASSSLVILALPVIFESERAQQQEQSVQKQREILLGPNAAVSGGGNALLPGMMQGGPPRN